MTLYLVFLLTGRAFLLVLVATVRFNKHVATVVVHAGDVGHLAPRCWGMSGKGHFAKMGSVVVYYNKYVPAGQDAGVRATYNVVQACEMDVLLLSTNAIVSGILDVNAKGTKGLVRERKKA